MKIACVDVGSTFTKAVVVEDGHLVATGAHRTTVDSDVLFGLDAAIAATGVSVDELLVCSSAGGGLRIAVIGYERLVTAEAGHRVALSAGGKVVHVAAGKLSTLDEVRAARPDVVLLVGGADAGDEETITHNALMLKRWRIPVVLAGNASCASGLAQILPHAYVAENVLPAIGVLNPGPARAAIREVFLRHVIGGKKLSRGPRFASLVKGATPDIVLTGVEMLARRVEGDLLVVDVGGATTDVYSVLKNDESVEVAGVLAAARTVEGDLGMRWSAPGVAAAAALEKLAPQSFAPPSLALPSPPGGTSQGGAPWHGGAFSSGASEGGALHGGTPWHGGAFSSGASEGGALHGGAAWLAEAAEYLAAHPEVESHAADDAIAALAMTVALRRHARGEPVEKGGPRRGGRDLRAVQLVVGSGGVLRHRPDDQARRILAAGLADHAGGYPLPRKPDIVVDKSYVLGAAGLLADGHSEAAGVLLDELIS